MDIVGETEQNRTKYEINLMERLLILISEEQLMRLMVTKRKIEMILLGAVNTMRLLGLIN